MEQHIPVLIQLREIQYMLVSPSANLGIFKRANDSLHSFTYKPTVCSSPLFRATIGGRGRKIIAIVSKFLSDSNVTVKASTRSLPLCAPGLMSGKDPVRMLLKTGSARSSSSDPVSLSHQGTTPAIPQAPPGPGPEPGSPS